MVVDTITELTHIDYRVLKMELTLPKLKTSAKSVQTTRVVSSNFSRSLYRLRRGFENRKRRCTFLFVYEAILMFVDGEIAYK